MLIGVLNPEYYFRISFKVPEFISKDCKSLLKSKYYLKIN